MRTVAVANYSTRVDARELLAAIAAVQKQIENDFEPIWGRAVRLSAGAAPGEHIAIYDDSTQAATLGYHDLDSVGDPRGYVFAGAAIDAGESWTVTFSHEVLEQVVDPCVDTMVLSTWHRRPAGMALEVCDPVDGEDYQIDGVAVANFIRPNWFQIASKGPWDFLGTLPGPLALTPRGYVVYTPDLLAWHQEVSGKTRHHRAFLHPRGRRGRRMLRRGRVS